MAFFATFIGIDRHTDSSIRDLTGARRDAEALHALFSDTIADVHATLLTDDKATLTAVRTAINETFDIAGPDDTVVLGFAGHGSRDHRLLTHDTVKADLAATTLPMKELSDGFKRCKAKVVFCLLDCCFSGGAPARVLEDSPIPRDPGDPLADLVGAGRFLLAASNIHEPAYEHPFARHGVLTNAFIEVLQAADGQIAVGEALDRILAKVRADAEMMGVVQTPVLYGHLEGGLIFPALRPGKNFYAAFPEAKGITIGHDIAELSFFDFPNAVLGHWAARFKGGLNDLQLRAVNEHLILEGKSLLVVAPTSSGKTFIGELAATRAILQSRKAIFLLPYRALVNEKYDQFQALYGDRLGMRICRCTGDYLDQTADVVRGKYDLAILTYEMFLNLMVGNTSLLAVVGLVVLDEAQFITDPTRGINVELLLTYLIAARARGICPQLIALSAVIGNVNDFDAWLDCGKLVTTDRPVRLIEGVLDRTGTFQFLDPAGEVKTTALLPSNAIRQRRAEASAQDVIVPLVRQLVQDGEQVIIFRNQRGIAQGCAKYLAADLGLPSADEAIAALPIHDLTDGSADLRECLTGGTAFHTTNLVREERVVVERAFREIGTKVRVLGATTTVAAGINTPANTVILAEQEFLGEDGRAFTVAEYKNMAGRAGRLGFQEEGKAIILADTPIQRQTLFARYVQGQLEQLHSSFDPDHLETWLIRLFAQVRRVPRKETVHLLASSYGGYLANRNNPKWRVETAGKLEALQQNMLKLELLEEDGDFIQLTLLGRACGRSALSFPSAMRLIGLLRDTNPDELSAERLMALLQVLPEADNGYTPIMRRGRKEAVWPAQAAQRYGDQTVRALQRLAQDEFDYYARCKRASILWDWIIGTPMDDLEKRYSATPFQGRIGAGDVRRFADATRFHLRSAHQIATVMFIGRGPSEKDIENLLKQLEVGIPADALPLLEVPIPLSRGQYLALRAAGVKNRADLCTVSEEKIRAILGTELARSVAKLRPSA